MTAQQMIIAAMLELSILEPGDTPNASELTTGLDKLNSLAASWDAIRLDASSIDRMDLLLSSPLTFHDLGFGSGTNTPRPIAIETAEYVVVAGSDELTFPLKIVGVSEYISESQHAEKARVPRMLYYNALWPTSTIFLYPKLLNTGDFLRIYYWRRSISETTDPWVLGTTLSMPPGYELALRLNLAVALAASYGRPLDQSLAVNAANSLAAIRVVNAPGPAGQAAIVQASGIAQPVPPDANLAIPK